MAGTKRTRAMGKAAPVSNEYVSDDFIASDSDAPASKKSKTTKSATAASKAAPKSTTKSTFSGSDPTFHDLSTGKAPRRVNVSEFKGKQLVNIREYYEKDGKLLPGKKGISLTTEQFGELLRALPDIKRALDLEEGGEEDEPSEKKTMKVMGKDNDDLKLTEKEKAQIRLQRKFPDAVAIEHKGKLYFVAKHSEKDLLKYDADQLGAFIEDLDPGYIHEWNEETDGPRELYEAMIWHRHDSESEGEEEEGAKPKKATLRGGDLAKLRGTLRGRGKKIDEDLTITAKEKAELLLKRKHPHTWPIFNNGKLYFVDDELEDIFLREWEEGTTEFLKQYKSVEYHEEIDGPLELYEAIIEYDYDSDMEAHVRRSRAAKGKAAPKTKATVIEKNEDGEELCVVMKLTKKEKAMIILERTHPSTFAITHEGKLFFIPTWLEEQWHHNEGAGLFIEENEDEIVPYDPEVDGKMEEYLPIADLM